MSIDHLALMRAGLAQQFKRLPILDAFMHAFGDQLNDLEELNTQFITAFALQTAVGVQLDGLGNWMGQGRNSLSDGDYRTVLQARVIQRQGNGTIEDFIQILLTLGGASSMILTELFPARVQINLADLTALVSNADLQTAALQTKLAGVGIDIFIPSPTIPHFAFDHAIDATHSGLDQGHLSGPIV